MYIKNHKIFLKRNDRYAERENDIEKNTER